MATYKVTLTDGQTFQMDADLVQASAPIRVNFHGEEDDWQSTPYQTADAQHSADRAAKLLAEHYSTGDDDCTDVKSVQDTTVVPFTVTITTASGAEITATVEGDRVTICQDGQWAGDGKWNGSMIVDCAARLGADGESDAAYDALDEAISDALAEAA